MRVQCHKTDRTVLIGVGAVSHVREGKGHSESEPAIGDRGPARSSEACDRH